MKPAEAFILSRPEPFKSMLLHLQMLIEATFPKAVLLYKWKLPFYFLDDKPICYLNPVLKKKYVDVCFWMANHQSKHNAQLVTENRKVVKSLRYYALEDIEANILIDVLQEAYTQNRKGFYSYKN